jgi:ATP-dependent RNA helicase DHX8/PRP22
MENSKLSLSMKEVDQQTGEDLNPTQPKAQLTSSLQNESILTNPDAPWSSQQSDELPSRQSGSQNVTGPRIRMSTPERWEFRQMQGGGAVKQTDLPDFDQELGVMKNYDGKLFINNNY